MIGDDVTTDDGVVRERTLRDGARHKAATVSASRAEIPWHADVAEPIPAKTDQPNGLGLHSRNPHRYWARTAQMAQQMA